MKVINFPSDRSVGEILISENGRARWENAIEGKGEIEIPEGKYVSFWLGTTLSFDDLDFLSSIKSDDLNEFLAASRHFDDSKAEKILHLSNLESLHFWETFITDETLKKISNFPKLRHLDLDTTRITDAGLSYLADLIHLKELILHSNAIKGDGLRYLVNLNLSHLDLLATDIDDDSIKYLKQMKSLKHLRIVETQISESGFLKLKEFLPDCLIRYNHPH